MEENAQTTQEIAKTRIIGKPFEKGNPGRPVGIQNKLSRTVKETVLAVFNELQADPAANLVSWAKSDLTEFYRMAGKLIPTEVTGSIRHVINVIEPEEDEPQNAEVIPE